jgi:DNA gyrase inhibitor GyrI
MKLDGEWTKQIRNADHESIQPRRAFRRHSDESRGRIPALVANSIPSKISKGIVLNTQNVWREITLRTRMFYLWGIGCLVVLGVLAWNVTARAGYESAPYKVIESDGNIEIREYPDLVLASTEAQFDARGNDGSFVRLFRYISGNNASDQKIEMTTPVFMKPDSPEFKGQMGFVIPQQIAEVGAPAPKASDVAIRKREGGRFAVIRFSGVMDAKKAEMQESKLREWLKARGLQGEDTSERAGYDPPFTPGPIRRNEVLIRLMPGSETTTPTTPAER